MRRQFIAWPANAITGCGTRTRRSRRARRRTRRPRRRTARRRVGGGAGGVADDAAVVEVVRQPAERHGAAEADVPVRGEVLGHRSPRRGHVDELGREVQHDRGLVGSPPCTPMPSSSAAERPPWSGGTPGWARNVISPWRSRSSRLATPTSARVAAVTVEEHEALRRGHRQAAADVVEHGEQRLGRQPERARRPGVLVRLGVRERRQQPDVELARRRARRPAWPPRRPRAGRCAAAGAGRAARSRRAAARQCCARTARRPAPARGGGRAGGRRGHAPAPYNDAGTTASKQRRRTPDRPPPLCHPAMRHRARGGRE